MRPYVIPFTELGIRDIECVGGKNASLGELIRHLSPLGIRVPAGYATTAEAYREFLTQDGLAQRIERELVRLMVDDLPALTATAGRIRSWILQTPFPPRLESELVSSWVQLGGDGIAVAVRSSATSEDLPDASFAGQQETFLNIRGRSQLLAAAHRVFASLYSDRAIAYRVHRGYSDVRVALSVGIQQMVRSDLGASGVMFTLDTESGFRDVVFVTASYGLGEAIVQGAVNPDEFFAYKPALRSGHRPIVRRRLGSKAIKVIYADGADAAGECVRTVDVPLEDRTRYCLSDSEVVALAHQGLLIEEHYGCPMDIEWALDGNDGRLYILQARPETVQSRAGRNIERYRIKGRSEVIVSGNAVGARVAVGQARIIRSVSEMVRVHPGDVLVADITDPDWEPVMKRAAAIVTNRGGRTCHAAIIARELGVPAVVGCRNATELIAEGEWVTVSCAEGDTGRIYRGQLEVERQSIRVDGLPVSPVKIMLNVANPERAFDFAGIPNDGVGLARLEFIINRTIGVHPRALLEFSALEPSMRKAIRDHIGPEIAPIDFFLDRLSEGIATIACAFSPRPVIVRLSDFKSNEYANLIGGARYEPHEENPMLGFRGASRFIDKSFRACFELECRALIRVRDGMGLTNVQVMVPFVRTLAEARNVVELLAANGLRRGDNDLKVIMMCELPTNALLADRFLEYFDGVSIGSNDMTQLALGVDRDSALIAHLFDERDPAVKALLSMAIQACRRANKYVGICGQGPSDHIELAQWLVEQGIESLSLNPDTAVETWLKLAEGNPRS